MTTSSSCTTFNARDTRGVSGVATITDGKFTCGTLIGADGKTYLSLRSLADIDSAMSVLADLRNSVMEANGLKDS